MQLASITGIPGGRSESVALRLYVKAGASKNQVDMNKLELNLHHLSVSIANNGAFKNIAIGGRVITSAYWEKVRPVMKFTNLRVAWIDGTKPGGVLLTFDVVGTSLSAVCGGACQYAAFDQDGNTGTCPLGVFGPSA